jgi:soluble lytic murein transglycosylase-like protein
MNQRCLHVAVACACLLGLPAQAAVYEVGDDGSVEQLDAPVALQAKPPARNRISPTTSPRAQAYHPYVAQASQLYEVSPALIDAIAHVESRYNQAAVSPAHARGIMQLMPGTARELGVDSRDPAANIRGGTAYLRILLNRFDGDVALTVAAYNAGPGAVSRCRCIPRYPETVAYVASVLERLASAAQ